jgi:hypothetical protein
MRLSCADCEAENEHAGNASEESTMWRVTAALVISLLTISAHGGVGLGSFPTDKAHIFGKWPIRDIPYMIAPGLPADILTAIDTGTINWNAAQLPITFTLAKHAPPGPYIYFEIFGHSPCATQSLRDALVIDGDAHKIGYDSKTQRHLICLNKKIASDRTVQHELGHVVGLLHEHTHCRAKLYISPHLKDEPFLECSSGSLVSKDGNGEMLTDYDMQSVMHYSLPNAGYQTVLGVLQSRTLGFSWSRIGRDFLNLSADDKTSIRALYP